MSPIAFVSDIHIKSASDPHYSILVDWLKNGIGKYSQIVFLGDIFELWVGGHEYFTTQYRDMISVIKELQNAGVCFHYVEGNHDLHLKSYWETILGVKVYDTKGYLNIGSKRIRFEHGDLMNPEDRGYLRLRKVLRSKPLNWLVDNLPGSFIEKLGQVASLTSRSHFSVLREQKREQILDVIRSYAQKEAELDPFELIVTGHVHQFDNFSFQLKDKEIHSINLGCWADKPRVLVVGAETEEILHLPSIR